MTTDTARTPARPPSAQPASVAGLQARLTGLVLSDERRLARRLDGLRTVRDADARRRRLAEIGADVDAAERRVERRRAAVPAVRYPEQLPVSEKRDEIAAAIRDHQVVVVAGETGSGKTTQLPKICLELGRGVRGLIGHTQPRRLAARTVAERIAEELDVPLGGAVGYTVRFTDQVGEDTLVRLMTDGILLAEIQRDRRLERYDTIIIDEAHERSLNVDFLLGYLTRLLPQRPDLKLIITSATIDPGRFAEHFHDAPVVEVSGRTYPVEVRYRPLVAESEEGDAGTGRGEPRDQTEAVVDAVEELWLEGDGDILVFLSGEREIRDTADALHRAEIPDTEVLPLYARLSAAEQHRVFQPHRGRRVVLATNVAETSLTVPGIRYVVDPGTARISRYSRSTKVQRLPIEPISQASARQRAGRCGRVAAGICIRLYSEEDYLSRPAYTDPEILRTTLAAVILQMAALGLGDVAAFPFLDPPDRRSIRDGVALLEELGALEPGRGTLTPLGRRLAQLPVDPRLARMVLEADRNGCLREVLVIVAALSIQDPRERPTEHRQAADEKHARFTGDGSDFLAFLNLWQYLREQRRELSSNQFRRMCRAEYLNYLRVREWQDLHGQLRRIAESMGLREEAHAVAGGRGAQASTAVAGGRGAQASTAVAGGRGAQANTDAGEDAVHQSLLAGLLSQIGMRDDEKREFLGARGARFAVAPGSALFKKPPRWVMAGELVETSRLWGRVVARIEPEWAERVAGHLLRRSYSEPHWSARRGGVVAVERVTLYGLPLVTARTVDYGRIDPVLSRELFIRHALVEGDWTTRHAFFARNRALLGDVEDLENRARRRDVGVDDETLYAFYDARIPDDVVSGRHFDAWFKQARRSQPDLLTFSPELLLRDGASVRREDFPDVWTSGDLRLRVTYVFEPGSAADGATVHVPLAALDRLRPDEFAWGIPGYRHELVTTLLRGLPKGLRTSFVPAPDVAASALARLAPGTGPLLPALGHELLRMTGVEVPPDAWAPERLPDHLRVRFQVLDQRGRPLADGRDLAELQRRLAGQVRALLADVAADVEQRGLRTFPVGGVPTVVERRAGGQPVTGYPALVDEGDAVAVRVFRSAAEQRSAMWTGTRRLLLLTVASPVRHVVGRLPNAVKLGLGVNPHGSVPALLDDCVGAATDSLLAAAGGPAWDEAGFAALAAAVRADLPQRAFEVVSLVATVVAEAHRVSERLPATTAAPLQPSVTDMRTQLNRLVYKGFVTATGVARLPDVLRYVRGIDRRLETLTRDPARDRGRTARVEQVQQAYREVLARLPADPAVRAAAHGIRWQIEELRISLFAQVLGTPQPVSEQRILRALDDIAAGP